MKRIAPVVTFLALMGLLAPVLRAQEKPLKAEVWDLSGPATYSVGGGPPRQMPLGTQIPAGAVIKTGARAALDLNLANGGMVRLTQNTVLSLDRLVVLGSAENNVEVQLTLSQGTMLGRVRKLPPETKLEIKVSNGVVSVRDGQYRINSEGYLVLLDGTMLFAYVPPSGQPVLHMLNAPPPVYFAPATGVQPAPSPLIKEVQGQIRARLRH